MVALRALASIGDVDTDFIHRLLNDVLLPVLTGGSAAVLHPTQPARAFFGGFLRHFPTRHAHKLMRSERDRAIRQHAGDDGAAATLPGLPSLRNRKTPVGLTASQPPASRTGTQTRYSDAD
jgi:hypothetical protein